MGAVQNMLRWGVHLVQFSLIGEISSALCLLAFMQ